MATAHARHFFSDGWLIPGRWSRRARRADATPRLAGAFEGGSPLGLVNGPTSRAEQAVRRRVRGNFTAFLPFSRRLKIFSTCLLAANGQRTNEGYRTDFGDIQVAASFLLSESEACTQLFTSPPPCRRVKPRRRGPDGREPALLI